MPRHTYMASRRSSMPFTLVLSQFRNSMGAKVGPKGACKMSVGVITAGDVG